MSNNPVIAALAKANKRLKEAQANTGQGALGWWPEEGVYVATLDNVTVEAAKFKHRKKAGANEFVERDATRIQTHMTLTDYPAADGESPTCRGREFIIPHDVSGLPAEKGNNQVERVRIQDERFKGMLCTILGVSDIDDYAAAIDQVQTMISEKAAANSALVLKVDFRYSENQRKKMVPDAEFYKELVSG